MQAHISIKMAATARKRNNPPNRCKKPYTRVHMKYWTPEPARHFVEDFEIRRQIIEPIQFGSMLECRRKRDNKLFIVKQIPRAKLYRIDRSQTRSAALLHAMQGEIDIMRRLRHKYIFNINDVYVEKHMLHIVYDGGERSMNNILTLHEKKIKWIKTVNDTKDALESIYIMNLQLPISIVEIIMDYYESMNRMINVTLLDRIHNQGRFSEVDAVPIIKMICEALHYMHELHRVVHCNLRPNNIFFVNGNHDNNDNKDIDKVDDKYNQIQIIDFGMSKVLPRIRRFNELCFTPYYISPEIIEGDYAHNADMWSVGMYSVFMIDIFHFIMITHFCLCTCLVSCIRITKIYNTQSLLVRCLN